MIAFEKTNEFNEIITFYSYKGGTGRTMALSNVACLLAMQNSKVLMMDWDLEAPGLQQFFLQEKFSYNSSMEKLNQIPGIIDLFIQYQNIFNISSLQDEDLAEYALNKVCLDQFITPTHIPNLHLLKAGRNDENYSKKVNSFNWEKLYLKSPSLFLKFAEKLSERYRYILIDSRTGITDISGICTMLLPQKLVVLYTPNHQSFTGIEKMIVTSIEYRRRSSDLRPLTVYPLPSRIEFSRDDLRADWRNGNEEKRISGYQKQFEDIFKEVYELDACNLTKYFDEVQIPQSPNYAYGEEIAVIEENIKDSFSLSASYEIFTQWLLNANSPWQSTESAELSNIDVNRASYFNNLGLEFEKKGEYEKANYYYQQSLEIYGKLDDKIELAQMYNKIGNLLEKIEKVDDALIHFKKALDIMIKLVAKNFKN